jgi:glycosyltransferase 2 family protein
MRWFAGLTALLAMGFFIWFVRELDWLAVGQHLSQIGLAGAALILLLQAGHYGLDAWAWRAAFPALDKERTRFVSLYAVNATGEAISVAAPFGAFGGEPIKAYLLNRRYGVGYRDATASLALHQTLIALAEAPFALVGVALLLSAAILPSPVAAVIAGAAAVLTLFMALVMLFLRRRGLDRLIGWAERSRWGERLAKPIRAARDVAEQMSTFLHHQPAALLQSLGLSFLVWVTGAVEIWLILNFLGLEISFAQAWMIETVVVLVRSVTFFVPAHLGAQDGAILALTTALGGSPELGLAAALVRRCRELAWVAIGLAIGGWLGLRPARD